MVQKDILEVMSYRCVGKTPATHHESPQFCVFVSLLIADLHVQPLSARFCALFSALSIFLSRPFPLPSMVVLLFRSLPGEQSFVFLSFGLVH